MVNTLVRKKVIKVNNKEVEQLLSLEEVKEVSKKKPTKKKVIIGITSGLGGFVAILLFMFYGPWSGFRNFWITTAMTTMNHRYLATSLYSDETIQKVLAQNEIIEPNGVTNTNLIKFEKYKKSSSYKNKYEEEIPEFILRTKVKAGLTGYAQVYGKYNTTPYDKLKLDLTYIENYSLWLDVKIMLLTFKILFQKENTEGVDSNQTTALKH